jgi:hypothetical protein
MIKKYFLYVIPCAFMFALVTGHGYKVTAALAPLIVGTWSGTIQTIQQLERPFFISTESPSPTNEVRVNNVIAVNICGSISGVNNELPCALPVTNQVVSFNMPDDDNLVKGTIGNGVTLQIALQNGSITGTINTPEGDLTIDGIVLKANRFFLLNVTDEGAGACSPGQFQGTASIVPSNKSRMIFTGSGVDKDCSHQLVTGSFTKP